ncbi:MAG: sigma-54 interaction domain-containing protein [Chitinophagales bacterium]
MLKLNDLPAELLSAIDTILNGFEGAIMVDEKGHIVILTDKYAELSDLNKNEVIGKHVLDVYPKSRMMEVVVTGKPIYADIWEISGETVFVSRMPIFWDGRIIGAVAVSVFRYMDEAQGFVQRIKNLDRELEYYKNQIRKLSGAKYSFDSVVGNSITINSVKAQAQQVAKTKVPVLIVGETGTGKELFAHAIHQDSPRRDRPFIRVNCASIPEHLSEAELFGYDEGAFTGARKGGKPGKFELAHGGTIFLDEVNELPYKVQAKLLRVLQEGEIERVGGTDIALVDVRVISATSSDLSDLVESKLFREDLFYRLNLFMVRIPALRERSEDIPLLCQYFLDNSNYEMRMSVPGIEKKVQQIFNSYNWPGNVRELKNTIERACINARTGPIGINHLPDEILQVLQDTGTIKEHSLRSFIDNMEKEEILRALRATKWNRNQAAKLLDIHRTSLYAKMKKYHLLDH